MMTLEGLGGSPTRRPATTVAALRCYWLEGICRMRVAQIAALRRLVERSVTMTSGCLADRGKLETVTVALVRVYIER